MRPTRRGSAALNLYQGHLTETCSKTCAVSVSRKDEVEKLKDKKSPVVVETLRASINLSLAGKPKPGSGRNTPGLDQPVSSRKTDDQIR